MPNCPSCGTQNLSDDHAYCFKCGYNFTGATGQLASETVLEGRYVIVNILGRGGMGAVYKALDLRLDSLPVAIKEMSTNAVGQGNLQAAITAFKKEATMLIRLRHPSLPRISDFFSRGEDRWYLVMDYIEGETLKEIIERRGPIPESEVLDWARQLCAILKYLHSQRLPIIFRDLKPTNIMLTPEGMIKLIDFGIARHFRPGSTSDTSAYGSSGYAPPEQYGEYQTDVSSDIYALGATLHHLLTGINPGKSPFTFEPPGKIVAVSTDLESAIMKAVELKPENRPNSVKEMLSLFPDNNGSQDDRTETLRVGKEERSEGEESVYLEKPSEDPRRESEKPTPRSGGAENQTVKEEDPQKAGVDSRFISDEITVVQDITHNTEQTQQQVIYEIPKVKNIRSKNRLKVIGAVFILLFVMASGFWGVYHKRSTPASAPVMYLGDELRNRGFKNEKRELLEQPEKIWELSKYNLTVDLEPEKTVGYRGTGTSAQHDNGFNINAPAYDKGIVYFGLYNYVYAVDCLNGKVYWRFEPNGPIGTDPVLFNGTVYFGTYDGSLYAVDSQSGQEKWRFYTGSTLYSTPAIKNNIIYFGSDNKNLYAIDSTTGQEKWRFVTKDGISSSPAVDNDAVYFSSGEILYAVNINTGQKRWQFNIDSHYHMGSSPIIIGDVIYCNGDSNLYAVDKKSGQEIWRYHAKFGDLKSHSIYNGLVYCGCRQYLIAIDANTGKEKWVFDPFETHFYHSTPVIVNSFIYYSSTDAGLYVVDCQTGKVKLHLKDYSGAAPLIVDNVIYLVCDDKVAAFKLTK